MEREVEVQLGRTLLEHHRRGTTYLADAEVRYPAAAYVDAQRWAVERRRVFREHPVVVGLASQLARPGDFVTFDLPDLPVLAVRGEDGRVRCFVNACRHRATLLVDEPCGHARSIVCPYHAWSYRTDGNLAAIPDPEGFVGIDPATLGLVELASTERFGLVWAHADAPTGLDLDAYLGPGLVAELGTYGLDRHHHFRSTAITVAANWKLMYDTFLEFYHGVYAHKATLAHLLVRNLVQFDRVGEHWRMAAAKQSIVELAERPEDDWDVTAHAVLSYDVFPNLAINLHGDHVAVYRVLPDPERPDRSVWHFSMLTPEPVTDERARRYFDRNFDYIVNTGMEDVDIAQRIQRTLASGANESVVFGRFEPVLAWYHQRIDEALAR
ncbi:MAG: aromatic ring-hydroxylating dioxygenase subunit alpha [Acidimicrobiia bacterium]|nr:aromatic ring-hydroxylating dioxygenase subunit alpha [Acidimicrobiia bacterium]